MAEVDTSFYPRAPEPGAFLNTAAGYVGLANAGEQNKLLQTQNKQTQLDLVNNQVGTLVNGFSTLAAVPDLSADHFADFGQRMVQEGIISPEIYAAEMKQVQAAQGNPDALRALAGNYSLRALDAGQRFSAQYGTAGTIDQGNALLPVTTSPMTGIHPIGAPIPKTLSPSELATPATIGTTPEGQPITGTTGQLLEKAGVNPLTAMPNPPALDPNNPLMPVAPAEAGVVTTLPVGDVAAMEKVGGASGEDLAAARLRETNFQRDILPLSKAIPALEALGTTGTGPGTEQINEIASFLQSMGVPGIDATKVKNFDEVRKYLSQYAQAGDPSTNDKLAAAFAANPSVGVSNAAAVDVAKTALALRKLQNAQLKAFEASGLPESQFTKFAAQFNAEQDPRAYAIDMMDDKARAKLLGDLKGEERAKFAKSLRKAIDLGLVTAPRVANGQ
ncbi:MAG: hypothetical protein JWR51_4705 [Devosia sp.]|uniref:hypothetical protein n=1 Tax=Devosia sp. TaxID=1871048 RepID=UPI0026369B38|nr:hypothetical protein [Devosia sp.]MDB5531602.1 hypothetical protein [Devosia sp.]